MNREIKFRVWKNKHMDYNPYWWGNDSDIYGSSTAMHINELIKEDQDDGIIYMQYTGLKDVNDKEVYEGDIVRVKTCSEEQGSFNEYDIIIKWNEEEAKYNLPELCFSKEVIGNIYETPELLKGGADVK